MITCLTKGVQLTSVLSVNSKAADGKADTLIAEWKDGHTHPNCAGEVG